LRAKVNDYRNYHRGSSSQATNHIDIKGNGALPEARRFPQCGKAGNAGKFRRFARAGTMILPTCTRERRIS
jgi:hypothetical protein